MPRELIDLLRACSRSPWMLAIALLLFGSIAGFIAVSPNAGGVYLDPRRR